MKSRIISLCVVIVLILTICGCSVKNTGNGFKTISESSSYKGDNETQMSEHAQPSDAETDTDNGVHNESLDGRGNADIGRSEPEYVGIIGYVAVQEGYSLDDVVEDWVWTVPIYEKDKQFWVEIGVIEHKTEVLVKEQLLEHQRYGRYSGYLLVEKVNTNEQFYINVKDFVTNPYWLSDDAVEAVKLGEFVAEFNQISDYYPVDKKGRKVELEDGALVLAKGITGTYGGNGPDDDTNQIEVIVLSGRKDDTMNISRVFINEADLTIVY